MLESIEQTWRQCETQLPEAQARADGLRDSVRDASELVRQKFDMLLIRLRDKCDAIPSSPDSALQAASYFEGRDNSVDRERAYYYLGSAYRDLKDYPRAVGEFLKAVDAARQSEAADTLIWQNALSQLTYLYVLQLRYDEELNTALQSVELARQSGWNVGFYLMDVASAYKHLNDTLHCLQYCDSSYQVVRKERFPQKYGRILSSMLVVYSDYGCYEKVDTLLRQLSQLPEDRRPCNYELCLGKCSENAGETDSAIFHYITYYNKERTLSGRYEACAGLQRCYFRKSDFHRAAEWGIRLYDTNDSIISQRAFEETQRAQDAYVYYRSNEKEQAIIGRDKYIISLSLVSGLALLSIVMGLLAYYNFRKKKFMEEIVGKEKMLRASEEEIRKRREELERKQQEIEQLGRQLGGAEQTIAASKTQLEDTMRELEQRTKINRELTRIALMESATERADDVIKHFHDIVSGQAKLSESSWKGLMSALDVLYPGFLEEVQERQKHRLREPLLHTICLLKIGLKPMQIAKVMGAKIQTVWNRVKRAEETCGDLLTM